MYYTYSFYAHTHTPTWKIPPKESDWFLFGDVAWLVILTFQHDLSDPYIAEFPLHPNHHHYRRYLDPNVDWCNTPTFPRKKWTNSTQATFFWENMKTTFIIYEVEEDSD